MLDGNQVIDMGLRTPYESLTAAQLVEYTEMSDQIAFAERMKREAWRQEEKRRKLARNPFYRLANAFGIL